jgi:transcriptional regulator
VYIPKHYAKSDPAELHALIDQHPLGTWVTVGGDFGLVANHVPFLLDSERGEFGTLVGHVARANPVWRSLAADNDSLVIFQGPDAYVSPSWYPSKAEHGKVVPTWNYAAVHAHGSARAIDDRASLMSLVEKLTARHETGRADPWKVSDAPADYIARRLDAIVGIEIPIRRIEGKWKVSQKEAPPDRRGIVAGLEAQAQPGSAAVARLVATGRTAEGPCNVEK